jgi:dTMP kinase
VPDLTILFDIDPQEAVARCGTRGDKTKFEKVSFMEGVRKNYLRLAEENPSTFVIIDASRSTDKIESDVIRTIFSYL